MECRRRAPGMATQYIACKCSITGPQGQKKRKQTKGQTDQGMASWLGVTPTAGSFSFCSYIRECNGTHAVHAVGRQLLFVLTLFFSAVDSLIRQLFFSFFFLLSLVHPVVPVPPYSAESVLTHNKLFRIRKYFKITQSRCLPFEHREAAHLLLTAQPYRSLQTNRWTS